MGKRKTNHRAEEEIDIAARGKNPKIIPKVPKKVVAEVINLEPSPTREPADYGELPSTSKNFLQDIIKSNSGPITSTTLSDNGEPRGAYTGHLQLTFLDWRGEGAWVYNVDEELIQYDYLPVHQILQLIKKIRTLCFVEPHVPKVLLNLIEHPEQGKELREKLIACEIEWIDFHLFKDYHKAMALLDLFSPSVKLNFYLINMPLNDAWFRKIMKRINGLFFHEEPVAMGVLLSFLKNPQMESVNIQVQGKLDCAEYIAEWKTGKREITRWTISNANSNAERPNGVGDETPREKDTKILSVVDSEKEIRIDTDSDSTLF